MNTFVRLVSVLFALLCLSASLLMVAGWFTEVRPPSYEWSDQAMLALLASWWMWQQQDCTRSTHK